MALGFRGFLLVLSCLLKLSLGGLVRALPFRLSRFAWPQCRRAEAACCGVEERENAGAARIHWQGIKANLFRLLSRVE